MFETLSSFSIFISLSFGVIIGFLLKMISKKPVTEKGVKKILVGLLFAPIIGKNVYLIGNRISDNMTEGIVVAPLLFGILSGFIIGYFATNMKLKKSHR